VPALGQQRVRGSHTRTLTCRLADCPVTSGMRTREMRHPCALQFTRGSAFPPVAGSVRRPAVGAPGAGAAGAGWCWQSHQEPPRHSSWWRSRHDWQIMSPIVTHEGKCPVRRGRARMIMVRRTFRAVITGMHQGMCTERAARPRDDRAGEGIGVPRAERTSEVGDGTRSGRATLYGGAV